MAFELSPLTPEPGLDPFQVALASVAGREHVRLGRNNQDAVAARRCDDLLVLAVADGCSGAVRSEVGAELSVRWLVAELPRLYRQEGGLHETLAVAAGEGLVALLGDLSARLSAGQRALERLALAELMLATVVVALVDRCDVLVFGVGDGVALVNGARVSPSGARTQVPPYPAYRLLPGLADAPEPPGCRPQVYWRGSLAQIDSLLIGSDGMEDLLAARPERLPDGAGLEALLTEARYARNASLVQKRLRVLGGVPGLLPDDTTLALLRRRPCQEDPPCAC